MSATADKQTPTLPYSIEAERAVLGSILRESDLVTHVADALRPEDFFLDTHQHIFRAMLELFSAGETADFLTVADRLRGKEAEALGLGAPYLVELMETAPAVPNVEHHALIVRRHHHLRRLIQVCQRTIAGAVGFEGQIQDYISDVEKEFLDILAEHDRSGIALAPPVVEATLEKIQENLQNESTVTGVPSGFTDLDQITGGWQPSDLVILAARPAMGKTAFALNLVINAVRQRVPTIFFSLEMSKEQVMSRILSAEARVDSSRLRRGDLTDDETDRLMEGARRVYRMEAQFGIDETPGLSLVELRSRCRRFRREHGLGLVVIDYLQLMTGSLQSRKEGREREISEISKGLKALAKEMAIPIIALAQLNRGVEGREKKRPKMSDLRESGSMEQDADQILFIYRDEYYNKNTEKPGIADIIIGKNRHGSVTDVELAYQQQFVCFQNLLHEQ